MIPIGAFEEWGWLDKWMHENAYYEYNGQGKYENMYDFLEETLNYPLQVKKYGNDHSKIVRQLDLLVPIKEKA